MSDYWDSIADEYQSNTHISTTDFHFGPLVPGDSRLNVLPPLRRGMTALEAGCGGAQNSIYLARQGVSCVARDTSQRQLEHARRLAASCDVAIDFQHAPLKHVGQQQFDLVHSVYALPFTEHAREAVTAMAQAVAPGGHLVLSTAHPVYAGEWLEVEGEGMGTFTRDYFRPRADDRRAGREAGAVCRAYPVSQVAEWIREAGLQLDRILEPRPVYVGQPDPEAMDQRTPYWSEAWLDWLPRLERTPAVVIYVAKTPRK